MEEFNKYLKGTDLNLVKEVCVNKGKLIQFSRNEYFSRAGDVIADVGYIKRGAFRYVCVNPSEEKDYPLSDYLEAPVPQQSNTNNEFKQSNQYIFMQKVINVIEDNIANENFNVKILADTLCMSQPTLYRKVKEHFHLTVTELIRKMRMNKAASLLAMRKYSILEITEMVGYNDYETFRKHFKSQFGVSASKYVNCE